VALIRERGVIKADQRFYSVRAVRWFSFDEGKIKRIDQIVAAES